jgi:proteasome alpha subunit
MKDAFSTDMSLEAVVRAAVSALAGPDRTLAPGDLEVAILERAEPRRAFRRIEDAETTALLGPAATGGSDDAGGQSESEQQ